MSTIDNSGSNHSNHKIDWKGILEIGGVVVLVIIVIASCFYLLWHLYREMTKSEDGGNAGGNEAAASSIEMSQSRIGHRCCYVYQALFRPLIDPSETRRKSEGEIYGYVLSRTRQATDLSLVRLGEEARRDLWWREEAEAPTRSVADLRLEHEQLFLATERRRVLWQSAGRVCGQRRRGQRLVIGSEGERWPVLGLCDDNLFISSERENCVK